MCDVVEHDHVPAFRFLTRRRFIGAVGASAGVALLSACGAPQAQPAVTPDVAKLIDGVVWMGHASFKWQTQVSGQPRVVYVDPGANPVTGAPYLSPNDPIADVVCLSHPHPDHFDKVSLAQVVGPKTTIVAPKAVADQLAGLNVKVVKAGDKVEVGGITIEATRAYNDQPGRPNHPKSAEFVGFVVHLPTVTYYHAGDTDNVPELQTVKTDVAFVPVGGAGFTMTVEEAAALVKTIRPKLAVPMHYGFLAGPNLGIIGVESDGPRFREAAKGVEVMILKPVHPFQNK